MKIGLIDVDGHNAFPNLALMKLSAFHKQRGDSVEFANAMFQNYDKVYKSKVFTFTLDDNEIYNCEVIKGGTGYRDYTTVLPDNIEHICPDYDLYNSDTAYGFLTRGCINKCEWCIVPDKEGKIKANADIEEFMSNKKQAILLDNNVLASTHGLLQIEKIIRLGIRVDFNQGLDVRLAYSDKYILDLLSKVKWIRQIRFACDTLSQLEPLIKVTEELIKRGIKPYRIFVYVLIKKDINDALAILNKLKEVGVVPFAQPYRDFDNKITPTKEQKNLARWCNHKAIFNTIEFKGYK
ncbi:MAG: radical SAM protein [Bacteroidales bacterium]|nr:radical SAM protein [Bacteroidales bacterium]